MSIQHNIDSWLNIAKEKKATHMVVIYDEPNSCHHPIFVFDGQDPDTVAQSHIDKHPKHGMVEPRSKKVLKVKALQIYKINY